MLITAPLLILLDFDDTLIDCDSSEWVAEQLGAKPLFDALRRQAMPWHQALNVVLGTLHSHGTTIAHIQQALFRLPLCPDTIPAIRAAHALGCDLRIISDANTFFVETFLHHHGIMPFFSHVYSNPAWIDTDGRLRYGSFHAVMSDDYNAAAMLPPSHHPLPPHSCPLCPPNMCKGSVIDAICMIHHEDDIEGAHDDASQTNSIPRIIYAGDGSGDYCPALRLHEQDLVLPRQGYPLSVLLSQNAGKGRARVHPWSSLGAALQKSLHQLQTKEEQGSSITSSCSAAFALAQSGKPVQLTRCRASQHGAQIKLLDCQGLIRSSVVAKQWKTCPVRGALHRGTKKLPLCFNSGYTIKHLHPSPVGI